MEIDLKNQKKDKNKTKQNKTKQNKTKQNKKYKKINIDFNILYLNQFFFYLFVQILINI